MSIHEFTFTGFNEHLAAHELAGSRCQTCGALFLPPHPLCTNCYGEDLVWEAVSGLGTLVAFTVIYIAPSAMIEAGYGRDNPYVSGIVRLEEGTSISAQIIGVDARRPESIRIGAPVRVAFLERSHDDEPYTALAFKVVGGDE